MTFANSLDPDQAQQNVGLDLDPICLTLRWYSWKNFSKKLILKKAADDIKMFKYPSMQRVHSVECLINGQIKLSIISIKEEGGLSKLISLFLNQNICFGSSNVWMRWFFWALRA